jgi:thymidine kinase
MKNNNLNYGWIEVITGCMFAGKTEELLRRVNRLKYAKKKVIIFKHIIDDRYLKNKVVSHQGKTIDAIAVKNSEEIDHKIKQLDYKINTIAIDEIHFFDQDQKLIDILDSLIKKGIQVIVAGLDQNYQGKVYFKIAELLAKAEFITKLSAVCVKCGENATKTQLIIKKKNDEKEEEDENVFIIGGIDKFEARCSNHHYYE